MKKVPQASLNEIPAEAVQTMVTDLRQLYDLGRPKTNEELDQRVDQYFEFCQNSSIRPGIESLCLSLHCDRTTFFKWSKGQNCDKEKSEICQRAKTFVSAYLEQASLSGRVNPPVGIFLMKNWLNYKDTISVEENIQEAPNRLQARTLEEIQEQFRDVELPPPIDTE